MTLSLAPFSPPPHNPSPVNGVSRSTYFNIWRGGPPGRRTNRPTWQVSGSQAAQSAPDNWPVATHVAVVTQRHSQTL